MGLLNPSPGEIIDRLTILELKIAFGGKKGMSTVHFEAEMIGLNERLKHFQDCLNEDLVYGDAEEYQDIQDRIARSRNALGAVNALLWQAEDNVRATPDTEAFRLAGLCKRIAGWNDARAQHVQELNKLYGLETEPEKLHEVRKPEAAAVTDPELGMN